MPLLRALLASSALLPLATCTPLLLAACTQRASLPDVIVLTVDTTRFDHVGSYGYERDTTPALDALARESVRYERAWSTSPWTLPAHASLFTGRLPRRHGAHFDRDGDATLGEIVDRKRAPRFAARRLPDGELTLAEILRERGYATGAFVAGPWLAPNFGLLQGYDVQDAEVVDLKGRPADALTDAALAWVDGVAADRPLHLLVNYFDPHAPYADRQAQRRGEGGERRADHDPAEDIDDYDTELRFMDLHLGRLVEGLRARRGFDEAITIVVADHGELFGEHGLSHHTHWLYEELIRVPLLIRWPAARGAGEVERGSVSIVDLLPAVLAELGLPLPEGLDGELPLGSRRHVVAEKFAMPKLERVRGREVGRGLTALIEWPWKLIEADDGSRELYHLERDRGESDNLAGRSPVEAVLAAALAALGEPGVAVPGDASFPEGIDDDVRRRLRELGYLEEGAGAGD